MRRFEVLPVTTETLDDFARLFETRGSPHYCWCTPYRFRDAHDMTNQGKRSGMERLVARGTPIGVLAYDADQPIGWCSVAPRETYVKLGRSRTMPRVTPPEASTWVVLCFFVARPARGRGVTRALLRGAVSYAQAEGARFVEGYPFDTAGISATHRGHSSVFKAARFRQDGARWVFDAGERAVRR